jgi:hypothetical protein
VEVTGGGAAKALEARADPQVKGRYLARFVPPTAGEYRIAYTPPGQDTPIEARLRVTSAAEELRQPNVNRAVLEQMAATSNGAVVELPDLASVEDRLAGESKFTELRREASLWDNWMTLTLLIVLYTLDVGLRRLLGLS